MDPKDLAQIAEQARQTRDRQQRESEAERARQAQQWKSDLPMRIDQFCQQAIEAIEERAMSAASIGGREAHAFWAERSTNDGVGFISRLSLKVNPAGIFEMANMIEVVYKLKMEGDGVPECARRLHEYCQKFTVALGACRRSISLNVESITCGHSANKNSP